MSIDDLIYNLGEWMRTTWLAGLGESLQNTSLNALINSNFWIVPIIQTIHILAIAAVMGAALMINLRIAQHAGHGQSVRETLDRYAPWLWWGLLVLLISGIGVIMSDPLRNLTNPVFWFKMLLLAVAITVTLWFQGSVRRNAGQWDAGASPLVRFGAGSMMALLALIIFSGRWIAYAPT